MDIFCRTWEKEKQQYAFALRIPKNVFIILDDLHKISDIHFVE